MIKRFAAALIVGPLVLSGCGSDPKEASSGPSGDLVLATTTSTQDSGLLDVLIPAFDATSACVVKTVAVGSGQAMKLGENGDADVLLVHSPEAEEKFMADGHGTSREPVMHNDLVLVGPAEDPVGLDGAADAAAAMGQIAAKKAPFASRADDSGTHAKELALWKEAGITPAGSWYIKTGQGMGATLTIANQKQAYTLSDRATFLATANLESEIVYEDSADLRNNYHVIVIGEDGTNVGCAKEFASWVRGVDAQDKIAKFGVDKYGEQLFFPDAKS